MLVCLRKLRQMLKKWSLEVFKKYRHCLTPMFIGVQIFLVGFQLLLMAICTDGCSVGGLSCRCITHMCGLLTLGLVLNASIAGPFVALSIVALTNIYLCYYNLQLCWLKQLCNWKKWFRRSGRFLTENARTVQFQNIYFGAFAVKCQIQRTQFHQLGVK